MPTVGRRAAPLLFLAPTMVLGTIFFVAPVLVSLGLSFTIWDSLSPPRFAGLANYRYLLTRDPLFYGSLWRTVVFVGSTLLVGIPLALTLALAFRRSRFKTFWRSSFWLPMVTNVVAVAYVWKFLLADPYGLVNRGLGAIGIAGPEWIYDPNWAMSAIVLIFVWFHVGQDMMLLSAGLDAIDAEIEEAAEMDGASPARVMWYVTLPMIRPTVVLLLLTNMVKGVGYFVLMLILTDGGPANSTEITSLHIYNLAFTNLRLGMASAAAYILLALVTVVLVLQLRVFRRGGIEGWAS